MSRVGKKPISLPKGVEVRLDGAEIVVKGPKGQVTTPIDSAGRSRYHSPSRSIASSRMSSPSRRSRAPSASSQSWRRTKPRSEL